jgi:hypothetical protein
MMGEVDGSMIGSAELSSVSLSMSVSPPPKPPANSIIAGAHSCSPHHTFPSIYKRIKNIYIYTFSYEQQQRMMYLNFFFVRLILEIHVIIF